VLNLTHHAPMDAFQLFKPNVKAGDENKPSMIRTSDKSLSSRIGCIIG